MVYPSRGWWALSQNALPATAESLSPYAGSPHPAGTIAGQLLANPSAVWPRNASRCRRTPPCLPSACTHQRLKKGSNDAGGAHRTPRSHHRAVWWRFQNDVRCVRSPHSAVLRVHLSRKVKVRLSLNQTRWRPVKLYEFFSSSLLSCLMANSDSKYTMKSSQARAIKCCKKTRVYMLYGTTTCN